MASASKEPRKSRKVRQPARTPEARENQLILMATELAEEQLANGTASSQVITHYLKLGTTREALEQQKLARENELLKAKAEHIQSAKRVEEMYEEALKAMKNYSGQEIYEEIEDD